MRAARLHAVGDLRVGEEPTPEAGPGMNLAARGVVDLGSLVSRQVGLGEVKEAFGEAARRTGLKVIIEPQR